MYLNTLSTLLSSTTHLDIAYAVVFIACICGVYLTIVMRGGDDIPRQDVDKIFFLMIGVSAVIWVLSRLAPPIA
ncbi:MAG: hypothetical protein AAF388_03420 [Bacteroidota bacterium]